MTDQFQLPPPPVAPGPQLPQLPQVQGPPPLAFRPVAPIAPVPPPLANVPGVQQGAPLIPQIPQVTPPSAAMPPMPAIQTTDINKMMNSLNPWGQLLQREMGYGLGRAIDLATGLPLTLAATKPQLTPEQKAQQSAMQTLLTDEAKKALGINVPSLDSSTNPQKLPSEKSNSPWTYYAGFTPQSIMQWQADMGTPITQDQANQLYEAGKSELTDEKKWQTAIEYGPTVMQASGTPAVTANPLSVPPPPSVPGLTPQGASQVIGNQPTGGAVAGPLMQGETTLGRSPVDTGYTSPLAVANAGMQILPQAQSGQTTTADVANQGGQPAAPSAQDLQQQAAQQKGITDAATMISQNWTPDQATNSPNILQQAMNVAGGLLNSGPGQFVQNALGAILGGIGTVGPIAEVANIGQQVAPKVIGGKGLPILSTNPTAGLSDAQIAAIGESAAKRQGIVAPIGIVLGVGAALLPQGNPLQQVQQAIGSFFQPVATAMRRQYVRDFLLPGMGFNPSLQSTLDPTFQKRINAYDVTGILAGIDTLAAGATGSTGMAEGAKAESDPEVAAFLDEVWNQYQTKYPVAASVADNTLQAAFFGAGGEASKLGALGTPPSPAAPDTAHGPDVTRPIDPATAVTQPAPASGSPAAPPPPDTTVPSTVPGAEPLPEDILDRIDTAKAIDRAVKLGLGGAQIVTADGKVYIDSSSQYDPNDLQNLGRLVGRAMNEKMGTVIPWENVVEVRDDTGSMVWQKPPAGTPAAPPPVSAPEPSSTNAENAPPANIPDWMQQNAADANAQAERLGVADRIEELAAQGLTAKQIARQIAQEKPGRTPNEYEEMVLGVRMVRRIPSRTNDLSGILMGGGGTGAESPEFIQWKQERAARLAQQQPNERAVETPSTTEPVTNAPPEARPTEPSPTNAPPASPSETLPPTPEPVRPPRVLAPPDEGQPSDTGPMIPQPRVMAPPDETPPIGEPIRPSGGLAPEQPETQPEGAVRGQPETPAPEPTPQPPVESVNIAARDDLGRNSQMLWDAGRRGHWREIGDQWQFRDGPPASGETVMDPENGRFGQINVVYSDGGITIKWDDGSRGGLSRYGQARGRVIVLDRGSMTGETPPPEGEPRGPEQPEQPSTGPTEPGPTPGAEQSQPADGTTGGGAPDVAREGAVSEPGAAPSDVGVGTQPRPQDRSVLEGNQPDVLPGPSEVGPTQTPGGTPSAPGDEVRPAPGPAGNEPGRGGTPDERPGSVSPPAPVDYRLNLERLADQYEREYGQDARQFRAFLKQINEQNTRLSQQQGYSIGPRNEFPFFKGDVPDAARAFAQRELERAGYQNPQWLLDNGQWRLFADKTWEATSPPVNPGPKVVPPADSAARADISLVAVQDQLDQRGVKTRIADNIVALETILKIRDENRQATPDEQQLLLKWSGWGDKQFEFLFTQPDRVSWYVTRQDRPVYDRFQAAFGRLSEDEQTLMKQSYLNANYSSKPIVDAMWAGMRNLGAESLARIKWLEPAGGVGRFLGLQPTDLATKSERHVVEMETLSADIMRQLYPRAKVVTSTLQDTNLPDNYYDLAISNVPFSDVDVADSDPRYAGKNSFLKDNLHNYFFAKTLDKLRPGGVIGYVTSTSSMDSLGAKWRSYMADNADFLGAFRLPRNAMDSTSAMADVLFFRKRYPNDPPGDRSWLDTKRYKVTWDGKLEPASNRDTQNVISLNSYWETNPDNVLGSWKFSTYRGGTAMVEGDTGPQFAQQLADRIANTLPAGVLTPEQYPTEERTDVDPNAARVPDGTHIVDEKNQVYVQRNGKMVKLETQVGTTPERIRRMLGLHDLAKQVSDFQNGKGTLDDLKAAQTKLRAAYWDFLKKYGPLHARERNVREPNAKIFRDDPGWGLISAMENWNKAAQDAFAKGQLSFTEAGRKNVEKLLFSDFLTKPMLRQANVVDVKGDPAGALAQALSETGKIDLNVLANKTGMTPEDVVRSLGTTIYQNPMGEEWQPADEYLSGDVVGKLEAARYYAARDPEKYARNVEALQNVQPSVVPFDQIDTRQPSAIFISGDVLDHFFYDLTQRREDNTADAESVNRLRQRLPRHRFVDSLGTWNFDSNGVFENGVAQTRYAVPQGSAFAKTIADLWQDILAQKPTRVGFTDDDGRFVLNPELTKLAEDRKELIRNEWQSFLKKNPEYAQRIERDFNAKFNRIVPARYDLGTKVLTFPGSNTKITIRPHQSAAIWRVIRQGRAGLFHEPGFGKTYTMIGAGMELRRLGLAKRIVYVVPKNILGQWGESFKKLYPTANILSPIDDDFEPANRANFLNRIRTNDFDAVIVSKEQFKAISNTPETIQEYYREAIRKYNQVLQDITTTASGNRFTQRDIQSRIARLQTKLAEAVQKAQDRKKTDVYWEDLGIDHVFVDEAHNYKNLEYQTTMGQIKGLPNSRNDLTVDMLLKTRELLKRRGGRGVVFATGTPMSNTLAEIWTMMRYLQPDALDEAGLENFDSWAPTFGAITPDLEQQTNGEYKEVNRFRQFNQVPELSKIWQLTADVRTKRDDPSLGAMKADLKGGARIQMSAPASDYLKAYMKIIDQRIKNIGPPPNGENALVIATDARKAALDMRLVDDLMGAIPGYESGKQLPEDPRSKINMAVETMLDNYREFSDPNLKMPSWSDEAGQPGLGTQVAFLDLSVPKAEELKEMAKESTKAEDAAAEATPKDDATAAEQEFRSSVYKVIIDKLVARGIPRNEIAAIHEWNTPTKRQELFRQMNAGEKRILLGSRAMLAEGVNIQKRLGAIIHLDAPWKPSALEQGEARALRDGNDLFGPNGKFNQDGVYERTQNGRGVKIYQFVTEESYDGVMWQAVETKAKAIMEMMSRDPIDRSIVDIDPFVMDAAAARARVAKDPLMLEEKRLNDEIGKRERALSTEEELAARGERSLPGLQRDLAENKKLQEGLAADAQLAQQAQGKFDFTGVDKKKISDPKVFNQMIAVKIREIEDALLKRPGLDIPESLKDTRLGTINGFSLDLVPRTTQALTQGNRFSKEGAPNENFIFGLRLRNADKPVQSYNTSEAIQQPGDREAPMRADWAERVKNTLSTSLTNAQAAAQRYEKNLQSNIEAASYAQKRLGELAPQRQSLDALKMFRQRIRQHLAGQVRLSDAEASQALDLIGQFRKGENPTIPRSLIEAPPMGVLEKLRTALVYQGSLHTSGTLKDIVERYGDGRLTEDFLKTTPLQTDAGSLSPEEKQIAINYLNRQTGKNIPQIAGASPGGYAGRFDPNAPIGPDNQPPAAGFNPLGAIKAHPRLTTAAILGGLAYAGMNEAQQEQQQKGKVDELTNIPLVNHVLDAGSSTVNLGDIVRGLNEYNANVLPVTAELVARVAEVPVSAIARGLGANASNVDTSTSFFDVLQPQAMQGINLSAPNETIKALQDSWATRQQHNPTLAFLTSLPADPLNWLGWEEGKVSASEFEKAAQPFLKPEVITAQDYEKAVNPINQASGHWWSQISRAAQSRRIANEFGMAALREGSRDSAPVETLERINKAMKTNSASLDQARLAHLWGQSRPVDSAAVMDLQRAFGIATPTSPDADVVRAIAARVKGKTKWNADDLTWLDRQFGYSAKSGSAAGRKLASINRVQQWAAVHGTPDLSAAIEAVESMTPREFAQSTVYKARAAFPARQSPLSAWMETANPVSHAIFAMYKQAEPGLSKFNRAVNLPIILSYLMSPGWTLHAGVENTLRSYRGSLKGFGRFLGGKVDPTPWYHDMDMARSVLGHYYGIDILEGRGGFASAPFEENVLTNSKFPLIGGAGNKWAADVIRAPIRNPMGGVDAAQASRFKQIQDLRAAAKKAGTAPDAARIKALLSSKPTDAMALALNGFANVVEKSNLSTLYGLNQYMVGKVEGAARTYWIAGEHAKVYDQVLKMMAPEVQAADAQLRDVLHKPAGLDDAVWNRIVGATKNVLHKPGALTDVVEKEIRGTIDRLNLAKSIFLEKDIPYPVQAELYMAMRHGTPEELQTIFGKGGFADQALEGGLTFMQGNRIQPMIDAIMRRPDLNLSTVAGQKQAWAMLDNALEAGITQHRDLWTWARAMTPTMSETEKAALYAEVRKINQNWLGLQRIEQANARRMFENAIRSKQGFATVPDEVLSLQDRAVQEAMATYEKSDALIQSYWADVITNGRENPALWKQMQQEREQVWNEYRASRNEIEARKTKAMDDFYAKNQGNPSQVGLLPTAGESEVSQASRDAANAALDRVRANVGDFTMRPTISGQQADALRAWVRDVNDKIALLPERVTNAIDDANQRTARIVQDRMRSHFVDHLNTSEVAEFARNFIPFWMYDSSGGAYYLWLAQHMPGVYSTADRLETMSGGTGYLTGGMNPVSMPNSPLNAVLPAADFGVFGVFGNKVSPARGLWPARLLTFQNLLERNVGQVKSLQDFFNLEMQNMRTQGILGMHASPLLEAGGLLAAGQYPNLPPPLTMATDISGATGNNFNLPLVGDLRANDQFLNYNIKMELAGKGIDPATATPQQLQDAERAVAIRDAADSLVPRFTYTSPEKLQQQKDFQDALAGLGYSKKDQADMIAQGFSPWSVLDSQQKKQLMLAHPDWAYQFEAADAFKTPEEQKAADATRKWLKANAQISSDRLAQQTANDTKLKTDPTTYTPQMWMKDHTKLANITAGRRTQNNLDNSTGQSAFAQQMLNKVRTPQDKAVSDYYTWYSDEIKKSTTGDTIDWGTVNQARKQYLAQLPPLVQQYVTQEITQNETDVEKQFYAALDQLDQYNAIPRWIGVPPAVAQERSKEEQEYARIRQVKPASATAYRLMHPLLARRLPRNPMRDQFLAKNLLLAMWFVPIDAKKMPAASAELNQMYFGEPVSADWLTNGSGTPEGNSSVAPTPVQPPPPVPGLAAG